MSGLENRKYQLQKSMQERREELVKDIDYVDGVLEEGAKRASEKACEVTDRVRAAIGM